MSDPLELSHSSGKFDKISDCPRQKAEIAIKIRWSIILTLDTKQRLF